MNVTLEVSHLTKIFKIYKRERYRIKELFSKKKCHSELLANDDISFSLHKGESVGIIGLNGAGKSTLLKQIAGVLEPTKGNIIKSGKVVAILELGTGFNFEISGRENIYFNSFLLGMSKENIDAMLDNIIEFSELEKFMDMPVNSYSSGMVVRLAFSIAIFSDADIFIIDEALSVGDAHFSQKCIKKLNELKEKGKSIIFVSHDLGALKLLCARLILLKDGKIVSDGDVAFVLQKYNFLISKISNDLPEYKDGYGDNAAIVLEANLLKNEKVTKVFFSGDEAILRIKIRANVDLDDIVVGFLIKDKFSQDIFGTNSYLLNKPIKMKAKKEYFVSYKLNLDIGNAFYAISIALHQNKTHNEVCHQWLDDYLDFQVIADESFIGIAKLYPKLEIKESNEL